MYAIFVAICICFPAIGIPVMIIVAIRGHFLEKKNKKEKAIAEMNYKLNKKQQNSN